MDPISLLHARPKAWLATSVLAPHAAAFATYLTHARYSSQSCGTYVASLAHLGRWMSQCCLPLGQLDEAAVELFLAVFVRRLAPHDQPISAHAVRRVIRDAFGRIGLTHGRSHALRHTLACRLLDQGGSIKEVADVLRHRSLNTTLIYAKLDHPRLAAVALPWPGSST